MEQTLATPADAANILKLYELRTEAIMRESRAWLTGEFWPQSAADYFAIANDGSHPRNAALRQVISYWEMAAAMVLHGAISADLFFDCNGEGFYILAKFSPFLDEIRSQNPTFMGKTQAVIQRFAAAATRYESMQKAVAKRRPAAPAQNA